LRSLPEPPTAVFAINDYTAWRFIQTWRSLGGKVPKDIAVVGFDNTERWSAMEPFMTSVSQPFEQIGREAAKLLLLRCDHSVTQTYRHVLLPAELVIRGSSE
jgi:DNA-binding LacI/PurR family transcriptional regulator